MDKRNRDAYILRDAGSTMFVSFCKRIAENTCLVNSICCAVESSTGVPVRDDVRQRLLLAMRPDKESKEMISLTDDLSAEAKKILRVNMGVGSIIPSFITEKGEQHVYCRINCEKISGRGITIRILLDMRGALPHWVAQVPSNRDCYDGMKLAQRIARLELRELRKVQEQLMADEMLAISLSRM